MTSPVAPAAAAGSWRLGDLTVHRMGFGAMRLPQSGRALDSGALPRDRDQAIAVLRRAVELGVNHIDTAAFYFSALRSANELINTALAPCSHSTWPRPSPRSSACRTLTARGPAARPGGCGPAVTRASRSSRSSR